MAEKITGEMLIESAVPSVADKLTLGWNYISPGEPVPDRKQMEAIAKELLTTKKLVVDGKEKLNIAELSDEDKAFISKRGLDIEGLEALADPERRNKFAAAIDDGVQSQDTWWNKIMSFISGLVNWMMSGFEGGFAGLWENIGGVASAKANNAVNASVADAMKKDPKLEAFAPYMGMVNETIHHKAMEAATGTEIKTQREMVTPLPVNTDEIKSTVKGEIQSSVKTAMDGEGLNGKLNYLLGGKQLETRKREFKEQLSSFIEKAATDPEFKLGDKKASDMSPAEFKAAIRGELVKQFDTMQVTGDDGKKASLGEWYKQNWTGLKNAPARYMGNLPSEAGELSTYLADQTLSSVSDAQLADLKDARGLAESGYQVGIGEILERRKEQKYSAALSKEPSEKTVAPQPGDNLVPSMTPKVPGISGGVQIS